MRGFDFVGGRCFRLRAASARSTCVHPQAWLGDALCSMVEHLTSRLYVLLPWNWKTCLSGTLPGRRTESSNPVRSASESCRRRDALDCHAGRWPRPVVVHCLTSAIQMRAWAATSETLWWAQLPPSAAVTPFGLPLEGGEDRLEPVHLITIGRERHQDGGGDAGVSPLLDPFADAGGRAVQSAIRQPAIGQISW
jgi:hypothetical protein